MDNRVSASAAFGRLRVETEIAPAEIKVIGSAAFGRLRVETISSPGFIHNISQPPSGGCVLKQRGDAG